MTNVYSLDGILVFGLLFVCTCAYFKKVPRLKTWLLSEKKGVWGVFYKGKIISGQGGEEIAISGQLGVISFLFLLLSTSRCDWNQAACCCGNFLRCNGFLRPVYKMSSKASISPTANQGDKGEEPVGSLGPA
ncbi:protein kish-B isoform X2 [Diceros bicornis minor]|uniref:protein kish-B isoform X2 n=1 Tax=Diceros bicornis minor TaxID=77932 RepID=UPI0026EAF39A|nr:protein kish-B isoform X2 [Diceros bicornis minor]